MGIVIGAGVVGAAGIGESDCELIGDEWLAQPVNAISSLAYVVVGIAITVTAIARPVDRLRSVVFAICLVAIGVGSVLFHGPQPAGSQLLHDLPILLALAFVVAHDLRVVVPALGDDLTVFGLSVPVLVLVTALPGATGNVVAGVLLAAAVVLEVLVVRRGVRGGPSRSRSRLVAIGLVALAAGSWLLGRTGSPACDPDAVFQFHGLWHVLSALVFGAWWWSAFRWSEGDQTGGRPVHRVGSDVGVER